MSNPASAASAASGARGGEPGGGGAIDPRVAEVLQSLRSGVRQRQAEAATMGGPRGGAGTEGGLAASLLAVRSHEYVQEPIAFSHRARLGKLIVFARKAFFHLFLKWFLRPLLAQQNAFNQAAGKLLQELAEGEERTARELRLLAARLAAVEAREGGAGGGGGEHGAAGGGGERGAVGAVGDEGDPGAGGRGAAVRRGPPP